MPCRGHRLMKPDEWHRVTDLFHGALERDPQLRESFLDDACEGDTDLRAHVDRLLVAHGNAGAFGQLDTGPIGSRSAADRNDDAPPAEARRGRPLRQPFAWLIAVVAGWTVAVFVVAVLSLATGRGTRTALGWSSVRGADGWSVASVDSDGPAAGVLRPGDRLVGFNGGPLYVRAGTRPYLEALSAGDTYRLSIDRNGTRLEPTLVAAAGQNLVTRRLTMFLMSLAWCMTGIFIGLAQPWRPVARLASLAAIMTGLAFVNGALIPNGLTPHPLHAVVGYHFFCRFPVDRPTRGAWRFSLAVLYAAGAIAAIPALWVRGTIHIRGIARGGELVNAYPGLFSNRPSLTTWVFYAALALMVIAVAHNYRRLTNEDQRRRVQWVFAASLMALGFQVVWAACEVVLGTSTVSWMGPPANILTAAIPLAVAYAVVRHQLFDIRLIIRRGVQYLLARRVLQVIVAIPLVAFVVTIARYRDLTIGQLIGSTQAYLYWLVLAGLTLKYRTPLQHWLDRRFFREAFDREQLLTGLLDDVRKVETIAELGSVVRDRLTPALHPTAVYIWYRDPDEHAVARSADPNLTPPDVPASESWLHWLEEQGRPTHLPSAGSAALTPREAGWFSERRIRLIVPMLDSGDRIVGALLFGEKKADEPYSKDDARLLETVAKQVSVVRENLRLRVRVGEEVRVRHDVLARLDGGGADLLRECPACGACFDGTVDRCAEDGRVLVLSQPVPRIIEGRYRLDRRIGAGGMGAVYEAHDLRLDRVVAVKILRSSAFGQPAALRRFNREARAAARINHPNIVSLYDYGTLGGGGAYLVMERVQGVTLRAALDDSGPLPPGAACDWFGALLDGVAAAHAAGIIHRDLKPENVIGQRGGSGWRVVKILDLGLAKFKTGDTTAGVTAEGAVIGTPSYMSPEQLAGRSTDERTDVYAVGTMVFEALTGRKPLPGGEFAMGAGEAAGPAGGSGDDTPRPEALRDLILRCLATDPRDRVSSAAELRSELIPLLRAWSAQEYPDAAARWLELAVAGTRDPSGRPNLRRDDPA
jgi:tRNA A-37 threonylcarbamoyl transferase component Bud32